MPLVTLCNFFTSFQKTSLEIGYADKNQNKTIMRPVA